MKLFHGAAELLLERENGYVVRSFERPTAAVREVEVVQTDADGAYDETRHHGAGILTMTVAVIPTPKASRDQLVRDLRGFLRPSIRPILEWAEDDGTEVRAILRAMPLSGPDVLPMVQELQAQWKVPSGIVESVVEHVAEIAADGDESGRAYNLVFNRMYPGGIGAGMIRVTNAGNTDAYPVVRIHGPVTDPRLANETLDQRLEFSGLTIAAGDYVELDFREKTVQLNSNPGLPQSRYRYLDFAASQWWVLEPGENLIRFYPVTSSGAAQAEVRWRDSWI